MGCTTNPLHLGPVYMRKNTSSARPGAERRGKFQPLFIWDISPHLSAPGWEAMWSKVSLPWNRIELTNKNQRIISIYLTIPVVFRLYGKISPHSGEIPPLVRWDFTIPVVLRSSCKRKMKIQRILWEGGISPLSPGSGRWSVFPHINRPLIGTTQQILTLATAPINMVTGIAASKMAVPIWPDVNASPPRKIKKVCSIIWSNVIKKLASN